MMITTTYENVKKIKSVISFVNLIIISKLTCNEGLYFRFLTLCAKTDLEYDILIESEKNEIDDYYKMLKKKGWFDFVDDFITPEDNEDGVRVDTELNYPRTIKTNKIVCENVTNLLGQIKMLRNI